MKKIPNIKKTPKNPPPNFGGWPTGRVKCPIFQSRNESIERITKAINEAQNIREKAILAKRLLKEVEDLLSCKNFDEKRPECEICQYISKIRKRTANLILKTEQLK